MKTLRALPLSAARLLPAVFSLSAVFLLLSAAAAPAAGSPFAVRVAAAPAAGGAAGFTVSVAVPEGHVLYADAFAVEPSPGAALTLGALPAPARRADPFNPGETAAVYTNSFSFTGELRPDTDGAGFTVSFHGCDARQCYMPETRAFRLKNGRFTETSEPETAAAPSPSPAAVAPSPSPTAAASAPAAAAPSAAPSPTASAPSAPPSGAAWLFGRRAETAGGYLSPREFLAFLDKAEGRAAAPSNGFAAFLGDPLSFFRKYGTGLTLLLVLLGGVLLNLTPCVLPMIPINLAIIGAGSAAGGKRRGFLLGGAYGAGMAAAYGGLGWAVLRTGIFVGSLQSSPVFNGAASALFLVFALALFGLFPVDFSRFSGAARPGRRRGGFVPAFLAGAFSALLAGACVAPVVLAVLILAGALVAEGHPAARLLPFALGCGMALPWPFAGAGLSVLPRPGAWMARVKQAFAVILLLLAFHYGRTAAGGILSRRGADADAGAAGGSIAAGDFAAWKERIDDADRRGLPVFVDFWAGWCKNCLAMEKTTFRDGPVKKRLAGYAVVKVRAERPGEPAAKAMLEAFAVRGLPGYVVLPPRAGGPAGGPAGSTP